jgi:predicted nucleic acid-binding protein
LRFWDTSSLIPLIVREKTSDLTDRILREDLGIVVWWETEAECVGALAQKFRDQRFTDAEVDEALERLAILIDNWAEIQPTNEARVRAERLLFLHHLKTADAMQLAAALLWCGDDPRAAEFVCQDRRLRTAARREGFTLLPTGDQLGKPF